MPKTAAGLKVSSTLSGKRLPGLVPPFTYTTWLKHLDDGNAAIFRTVSKNDLDQYYESLIRAVPGMSDGKIHRHMEEVGKSRVKLINHDLTIRADKDQEGT